MQVAGQRRTVDLYKESIFVQKGTQLLITHDNEGMILHKLNEFSILIGLRLAPTYSVGGIVTETTITVRPTSGKFLF